MSLAFTSTTTPAATARDTEPVRITLTIELPGGTGESTTAQLADSLRSHAHSVASSRGGRATVAVSQPTRGFSEAPGQRRNAARSALPPRRGALQPVLLRPRKPGTVSPNAPARRDAKAAQLRLLHATSISPVSPVSPTTPSAGPRASDATNATLRKITARTARFPSARTASTPNAGILIDLYGRRVRIDGGDVDLTHREFELLAHLASHARTVVSRDQLMNEVWRDSTGDTGERTVDVHIRRVRTKLGRYRKLISTVRGEGYRLNPGSDVTIVG